MNDLREAHVITLPPCLDNVHGATQRVLAWCTLQGVPRATSERIELPLVEALNNAILHGCLNQDQSGRGVRYVLQTRDLWRSQGWYKFGLLFLMWDKRTWQWLNLGLYTKCLCLSKQYKHFDR